MPGLTGRGDTGRRHSYDGGSVQQSDGGCMRGHSGKQRRGRTWQLRRSSLAASRRGGNRTRLDGTSRRGREVTPAWMTSSPDGGRHERGGRWVALQLRSAAGTGDEERWWLTLTAATRLHDGNWARPALGNGSGGSGPESSDGTRWRLPASAATCDCRDGACCDQATRAHGAEEQHYRHKGIKRRGVQARRLPTRVMPDAWTLLGIPAPPSSGGRSARTGQTKMMMTTSRVKGAGPSCRSSAACSSGSAGRRTSAARGSGRRGDPVETAPDREAGAMGVKGR
jgi:hypothetical protein